MAKPEWGTKRVCLSCGARFYDLQRSPITCPSCGAPFDVEGAGRARRSRPATRSSVIAEAVPNSPLADEEVVAGAEDAEADLDTDADAEEGEPIDESEESEEDDALIEDASELGEDEEDMSEVIEGGLDEDEDHR